MSLDISSDDDGLLRVAVEVGLIVGDSWMSGAGSVKGLFENSNKDKGFNFFQLMKYVKVGVPKNTMRKLPFHIDWQYSGLDTIRRRKPRNCSALLSIQKKIVRTKE